MGHQLLHSFNNDLHHHSKTHHYHTISDHQVKQSQPSTTVAEQLRGHNFISLLFGISIPIQTKLTELSFNDGGYARIVWLRYNSLSPIPPTPPPLDLEC